MQDELNKSFQDIDKKHYLQAFKRYPITLDRGEGSFVYDVDGNKYLDALGGIAVNGLGHCHPDVVTAIQNQAAKLMHISNFYLSKPQAELAEKLVILSGLDRVFLTNSGAESVEGAIKLARKFAHSIGRGGKIISFEGCFHGRTMATIATGKKQMQAGFDPIPQGFMQIPFNDIDAVESSVSNDVAAFLIEPIQGEGGIIEADVAFVKELRRICDEQQIVLIFDEVQTGMGRTGKMFAKDHFGINPDIMCLAKSLGSGFPIGAILSTDKVSGAIEFGDHGTTFGGNPLACAAALATIETIESEKLINQAAEKGNWLRSQIKAMAAPCITDIRGKGLMIGVVFDFDTKILVQKMLEHGVLVNATAGNVLRLVPALNINYDQLNQLVDVIKLAIKEVKNHG